jgi:hypothetical protein
MAFGPNDIGQVAVAAPDGTKFGIWRQGTFTPLPAPPGGYAVTATGINNFRQVACGVTDAAGNTRDFIGTPDENVQ